MAGDFKAGRFDIAADSVSFVAVRAAIDSRSAEGLN
jgi:hypothetical protein